MPDLLQPESCRRARRVSFEDTPVVLRQRDGHRSSGHLEVLSATGGLIALSRPLDPGARVKLMFLTAEGSVLGEVEMLPPMNWERQAFRFIELYDDDRVRLWRVIDSRLVQTRNQNHLRSREREQVEQFRAW